VTNRYAERHNIKQEWHQVIMTVVCWCTTS